MDRKTNLLAIGKCLDRYENILRENGSLDVLNDITKHRFDRFIDLDVSKVNAQALLESNDETFCHDMAGVFANLERNCDDPNASKLKMFVPRVGFLENA